MKYLQAAVSIFYWLLAAGMTWLAISRFVEGHTWRGILLLVGALIDSWVAWYVWHRRKPRTTRMGAF